MTFFKRHLFFLFFICFSSFNCFSQTNSASLFSERNTFSISPSKSRNGFSEKLFAINHTKTSDIFPSTTLKIDLPKTNLLSVPKKFNSYFTINNSFSDSTQKPKGKRKGYDRMEMFDAGFLVVKPALKSGVTSAGLWQGAYADVKGLASFGVATGFASYQDSAKTIYAKGLFCYFGFQYVHSLLKNKYFDIMPLAGMGFQYNRMENIKEFTSKEMRAETNGIGMYVSAGLGLTLGPLTVKAKVQAIGSINTNKANLVKGAQLLPSLTVGIKPGKMFFEPEMLTVDGVHVMQEKINERVTQTQNATIYSYQIKTTITPGSISVNDVRPYFYVGPTFSGSLDPDKKLPAQTKGFCLGFRRGPIFMEAGFESGEYAFMDQIITNPFGHAPKPNEKNYGLSRMDGAFLNSSRSGVKFGLEMITWGKRKGFLPYTSEGKKKMRRATSYYAIIPNVGIGSISLGNIQFADTAGLSSYKTYLKNTGQKSDSTALFLAKDWSLPKNNYTSFGINFMIGAISLEYTIYTIKYQGKMQAVTSAFYVAYKLPILRVFRMPKANRLKRELSKPLPGS